MPGNGAPDRVHLERFAVPGRTLLAPAATAQSAGALGSLGLGGGTTQLACALAGRPVSLRVPKTVQVRLQGAPPPWVGEIDLLLDLVRRLGTSGGQGRVLEYDGEGLSQLTLPQRAVLAGGGWRIGAFASLFPAQAAARDWLRAQGRSADGRTLAPDAEARYDEILSVDLATIVPLVAKSRSLDTLAPVADLEGTPVQQVVLGGSIGGSAEDLASACAILRGTGVAASVDLRIIPASRHVLHQIAASGLLDELLEAGARIDEPGAGPSGGIGEPTHARGVSVRTGLPAPDGSALPGLVLMASVATAALAAREGRLMDPRGLDLKPPHAKFDARPPSERILAPSRERHREEIHRAEGLAPLAPFDAPDNHIRGAVLARLPDRVASAQPLAEARGDDSADPLRRAVAGLFASDREFQTRLRVGTGGFVVAGREFGTGAPHERSALALRAAGIRAVLAKSFAPEQRAQLILAGVPPLAFLEARDADAVAAGDEMELLELRERSRVGEPIVIANRTRNREFQARLDADAHETAILLDGGLLRGAWLDAHPEERRKLAPKPVAPRGVKKPTRKATPKRKVAAKKRR